MNIKIGFHIVPMHGDYKLMRDRWTEAEALGVDGIYTADHFFPQDVQGEKQGAHADIVDSPNFEATTLQAAMAATTSRVEIGCLVHAVGFRNPNLLADIARTIDHISGGRFVLGIGAGYQEKDYVDYGYDNFGTQKSRLRDLAEALPIIKDRFSKLNPPPIRKIPIQVGSMGKEIGLRIVAQHADRWHVYGDMDHIVDCIETLKIRCKEVGRDFSEIELCSWYSPDVLEQKNDLDEYVKLGIRNIITPALGPKWDMGILNELLQWRRNYLAKHG